MTEEIKFNCEKIALIFFKLEKFFRNNSSYKKIDLKYNFFKNIFILYLNKLILFY